MFSNKKYAKVVVALQVFLQFGRSLSARETETGK